MLPESPTHNDSKSPFAGEFLGKLNSISAKLDEWKQELYDDMDRDFLLQGIESGFSISDIDNSGQVRQVECENHPSSIRYANLVEKELKRQMELGYYVKASVPPTIISPIAAVKKEDSDEVRIIHDASRPLGDAMNDYATSYSVKYQTLQEACKLAKPGYFLAKVDLKSAYRSVAISEKDYCLTGLKWHFKGDLAPTNLFDTRLCFGAKLGPAWFHRISQAVGRMMEKRGYKVIIYIDDFLIVEDCYKRCHEAQLTLIRLLIRLGFAISWHKVLGPSQAVPFLGIVIDTSNSMLYLEDHKVAKLHDKLVAFQNKKRANKRQLQSLAGSLNWACQAVVGGRFFLRRILDVIKSLKESQV